jgi:DSF synthase
VLAPDGAGEATVYSYIKKHAKAENGRRAIESVRRAVDPLEYDELVRVVGIWADAALRLSERDLKMMERLVRAQDRNSSLEVPPSNVTPLAKMA